MSRQRPAAEQAIATDRQLRWSDPFERLSVGQRFAGGERAIGETEVMVFCALTGDWHPQHCARDWARLSPFGERIAHGMLILSVAVGLVPLDPERVLALRRLSEVVFKRPVRLGDTIALDGQLTALRPLDGRTGLVELTWQIRNQDRALVCRAEVQLLWRREQSLTGGTGLWHEAFLGEVPAGQFVPLPL